MKNFLRDIRKESDEYREDAIRIEEMQRSLTAEYRSLASSATNKVFLYDKPKSPIKSRGVYQASTARTARNKSNLHNSVQFKKDDDSQISAKTSRSNKTRKGILITQDATKTKTENSPKAVTTIEVEKKNSQINIDLLPSRPTSRRSSKGNGYTI